MDDGEPKPNNPLSPYYPAELPAVPGEGRRWFAVLFASLLPLGTVYGVLSFLLSF